MTASFLAGPLARILLRWLAGVLLGIGLSAASADFLSTDPDVSMLAEAGVSMALSFLVGAAAELYYWAAKRWGWAT